MAETKQRPVHRLGTYLNGRPRLRIAVCVLLVCAMTGLQLLPLDLSCGIRIVTVLSRRPVYYLLNLGLVFSVDLVFLAVVRRWHLAYILGSVFFCIWAVANYYTALLSGSVLTLAALRSAGTAFAVLGGYRLAIDLQVVLLVGGMLLNILLSLLLKQLTRPVPWKKLWLVVCAAVVLDGCIVGSLKLLKRTDETVDWIASNDTGDYGYPVYFTRQALQMSDQVIMPAGYDSGTVQQLAESSAGRGPSAGTDRPADIILILNESFYDLDDYTDLETDVPYLENFTQLTNAVRGRAAVPSVGGGTNRTEYELLTGNSMALLSCPAPFINMDMSSANSIVRYLAGLGYAPAVMHPCPPANYNRGIAYPALGFDQSWFEDSFQYHEVYGTRHWTDAGNYRDLFRWYEQGGDGPRFLYLLTFQNHGGYEQNDASLDTVHTGRDLGGLTDDVDEFLTSIQMSDAAIRDLTDYFDRSDRPVLVCMLGDHAPSFISQLPPRQGMTEEEEAVVARSTPFFIWANQAFGPIETADGVQASVVDLVPMLLDIAGLPLSPYYQTILDLHEQIPIRLSTGQYQTAAGETGLFSPDDSRYAQLAPYYFMEYNSLQKGSERIQALFEPPAG